MEFLRSFFFNRIHARSQTSGGGQLNRKCSVISIVSECTLPFFFFWRITSAWNYYFKLGNKIPSLISTSPSTETTHKFSLEAAEPVADELTTVMETKINSELLHTRRRDTQRIQSSPHLVSMPNCKPSCAASVYICQKYHPCSLFFGSAMAPLCKSEGMLNKHVISPF